jgi:glycosyltransferase 2 family protein
LSRKGRLIGFLVTAIFIFILARNLSVEDLVEAFRGADYRLVLPAAVATLAGYTLRSVRWQRIVRPAAKIGLPAAFSILMMGFAANNLLPARLGEFVRAYLLRRKTGARKTFGMATVFLERVCDGVVLIAMLGIVSLMRPLPMLGQQVQMISSLIFLGSVAGILMLLLREGFTVRLLDRLLRPLPARLSGSVLRASRAFIAGLQSLKNPQSLVLVITLSISVWMLEASSYFLMMRAFNVRLDPDLLVLAALLMLVTVNLGIMVPSAPGYVGTFQFFAVTALAVFGVDRETALAVGISSHLMQYILVTGIGLALFAHQNLSLSSLQKESSVDDSQDEESGETGSAERNPAAETVGVAETLRTQAGEEDFGDERKPL